MSGAYLGCLLVCAIVTAVCVLALPRVLVCCCGMAPPSDSGAAALCHYGAMDASLAPGGAASESMLSACHSEGLVTDELGGGCSPETMAYISDCSDAEIEVDALPDATAVSDPLQAASFVYHGIYFAGARNLMPSEIDLKFEFLELDIYLIRGVRVDALPYPSDDPAELLAFSMVSHGQVRWPHMLRLVQMLPCDKNMRWSQDGAHMVSPRRFTIGAYNQGPMAGNTITTRTFPWTASVLSGIVSTWDDTLSFSTCTLSLNVSAKPHKDSFNHHGSRNLVLPLSRFVGGGLFVACAEGRTRLCANGPSGHIIDLFAPVSFSPRALHASMPWNGTRLLLIAYHIGQSDKLSDGAMRTLECLGFRVGRF